MWEAVSDRRNFRTAMSSQKKAQHFFPFEIRVPATSANLGPGFDGLGLAVNLYNQFEISLSSDGINRIEGEGSSKGVRGPDNLFFRAFKNLFEKSGAQAPLLHVRVRGNVPMARGLGSSSTAIVAGILAANHLAGKRAGRKRGLYEMDQLLLAATREEGHPDNVVPALLGGLVASVQTSDRVIVHCAMPHPKWRLAMFIPDYPLKTKKARRAIPKTIPHADAVYNLTRTPLVMDCLIKGRKDDLGAVLSDRLHEPYRKKLIPGFEEITDAARKAGASAAYLSGAGPILAAFCWGESLARKVTAAMSQAANRIDVGGNGMVLKPVKDGAKWS